MNYDLIHYDSMNYKNIKVIVTGGAGFLSEALKAKKVNRVEK